MFYNAVVAVCYFTISVSLYKIATILEEELRKEREE